jgi:sigma54-dependent transcription regulator
MEGQRLVFVFGLLGIGKSVIARNVLHFMKERKYFCGGLIFISLSGTKSMEELFHSLF